MPSKPSSARENPRLVGVASAYAPTSEAKARRRGRAGSADSAAARERSGRSRRRKRFRLRPRPAATLRPRERAGSPDRAARMKEADVVIVGGGIVGVASAFYLAQRGQRVLVVAKGVIAG